MPGITTRLECRSDTDYPGRPLAFHWESRRRVVESVLASWRTPEGTGYRIVTCDGAVFDCCYSALEQIWRVNEIGQAGKEKNKQELK